jgi:hypothetical protein
MKNLKLVKELDLNPKNYFIDKIEIVENHSICFELRGQDEYAGSYSITFYNDNVHIGILKSAWNEHYQSISFWEKIEDRDNIIMFIETIVENQKKEFSNSINVLKNMDFDWSKQ